MVGKLVSGKTQYIPSLFMFGGCVFINWFRTGLAIPIPEPIVQELLIWGFDPYGD
jgi:hypothetical protein